MGINLVLVKVAAIWLILATFLHTCELSLSPVGLSAVTSPTKLLGL
jgi:dipeptide/tripeptide permease